MLIVCTQDVEIREAAESPVKGGAAWAPVHLLPAGGQAAANEAFEAALGGLGEHDPLCLSAHGNDTELGDENEEGWGWTTQQVAELLAAHVVEAWGGPILIHACAKTVANFSAGLAVALQGQETFNGLWCFGYNVPVPSNSGFPPPEGLAKRVDLQGTQVHF